MSDKDEALRLADALENLEATGWGGDCFALTEHSEQQAQLAAAELRRLHAERDALRADAERWRYVLRHSYDDLAIVLQYAGIKRKSVLGPNFADAVDDVMTHAGTGDVPCIDAARAALKEAK